MSYVSEKEFKLRKIERKIDSSNQMLEEMTGQLTNNSQLASVCEDDDTRSILEDMELNIQETESQYNSGYMDVGDGSGSSLAERYTITFNSNEDKESSTTVQIVKVGFTVTLRSCTFRRQYFKFVGWSADPNAKTPQYTNRAMFSQNEKKDITLYAIWEQQSYTVSFNANGGTGTMSTVTFIVGKSEVLPACTFKRTSYTFNGWGTSSSSTIATYSDKQKIIQKTQKNLTLYAIWKVAQVTVSYNANGGTGTMKATSVKVGTAINIPNCSFTRSGYTFSGWATSATGAVAYGNKGKIKPSTNVVLYAVWVKVTAPTISYGKTLLWYGRVNNWGKSKDMLASEVSKMKSKGLTGYMIEAAIYRENEIKTIKKADLSKSSVKAKYDSWLSDIRNKYEYLLGLCRNNNMWLFISIVNDNAISKTKFEPAFLYDCVATDILNIVVANGSTNVVVQPTAEVGSGKGLAFNRNATSRLKSLGFKVANGGAKHGDDKNTAGAHYMAYHQSEYNQSLGTPSNTFIVSDNTQMINWLKGNTSHIQRWRDWVKGKKYLVCGYYDVQENGDSAAINAMGG